MAAGDVLTCRKGKPWRLSAGILDNCEGSILNLKPTMLVSTDQVSDFSTKNLILCSANRLLREGLRHILTNSSTVVVAEVRLLEEAHNFMCSEGDTVGVIVCDADDRFADSFESLKAITSQFPQVAVVVLADEMSQRDLDLAVLGGARGFLPKNISAEALQISLALVILDEDIFAAPASLREPKMPTRISPPSEQGAEKLRTRLSTRESQILRCLENGLPNKTIARDLDMAEATVKVHLKALLRKINVENRTQAAVWSMHHMHASSSTSGDAFRKPEPLDV